MTIFANLYLRIRFLSESSVSLGVGEWGCNPLKEMQILIYQRQITPDMQTVQLCSLKEQLHPPAASTT
jgi:hypothetical protein